jgi:hypothetical protein
MWLFTRYGFYSTACARRPDGSRDADKIMVRARCEEHLNKLKARIPALASFPILLTPERDYGYRIVAPKVVWATSLYDLAAEQDWSNFKNQVAAYQGDSGAAYVQALHDVWARMGHLQPGVPQIAERVARGADGSIINAEQLEAADLANQRVRCPACGRKVFAVWPEGWDGHAGWACTIEGSTPEERKQNYKDRFRRLFR